MRYLISISYDGSKFFGFQRQGDKKSVQKEIEKALTKINKQEVIIKGAGRTDRGVHAYDQKAHFDLDVYVPEDRIINAINSIVKPYIKITDAKIVDDDFHARFSVKKKTYTYVINMGEFDPINNDYLYNYNRKLNIYKMKCAAKKLIGAHSFSAFVSGTRDNADSIIYDIKIKRKGDLLKISFVGKSFYRYMVRNLVGALISIGDGKESVENLRKLLNTGVGMNYTTAPANGLYLEKIEY